MPRSHTAGSRDRLSLYPYTMIQIAPISYTTGDVSEVFSLFAGGGGGGPAEICTMEVFNASCPTGEVILIQSARYGRMSLGRCVQGGYGHLGCAVDVRSYLDSMCSGRSTCQLTRLPDPVLFSLKPCPGDFTSYLEVSYECLTGI